jgi:hypothetical protein
MRGNKMMGEHPEIARLRVAGFAALPMLNSGGVDDALLFWRWSADRTYLDLITVWNDNYAVCARLPAQRNWAEPFVPTAPGRKSHSSFREVVDALLGGQRNQFELSGEGIPSDRQGCNGG